MPVSSSEMSQSRAACSSLLASLVSLAAGHLNRGELEFQQYRIGSIGDVASHEAGIVFEKVSHDYPALYRQHAFTDPKQLAQRLSTLLEDTALSGLLPSGR